MTWAHPRAFWLLAPVIAALLWTLNRGPSSAALSYPADEKLWSRGLSGRARLARWAGPVLKTLALLLVVCGLARPQSVMSRLAGMGRGIDIILAMDTSLSMSAIDFDPLNRLDAAKDTARRFIEGRVQDRIGLIVFGGAPLLAAPLTADYDALYQTLDGLTPGMTRTDGTAIGDGIVSAVNHLKDSDARSKIVILLTDGRSNTGLIDPVTAAKTAASLGIKVYTIGCGKRGQSVMPVDDPVQGRVMVAVEEDLDEDLLSQISELTEGRYFRATSLKELREIYATIDKLEKSSVKLPDLVSRDDRYQFPVLLAAVLLLLDFALSNTWLLRWP
ncbi:MAG: VWA domain-containing protein [Elusimicrobia bacterium]|nr:VWA domain-containing protein [Elusimicrobiota bacterium]